MKVDFKVRNKDKLFAAMEKSVPALRENVKQALAQGGEEMVKQARQFAPVDEGELRNSIEWNYTKRTKELQGSSPGIIVMAGAESTNDDAFYASFLEHGTTRLIRRPFFFPAYRLLRRKIRGRISRSMTKAFKQAGLK